MKLIISFLFIFISIPTWAAKWIDLEWEGVEGAKEYELEVTRIQGEDEYPLGIFQTKKPKYKKKVIPGQYEIKIRTVDNRGVPGDWSDAIEVAVDVTKITRYRPLKKEEIPNIKGTKKVPISFVWEKIEGLKFYQLTVTEMDGGIVFSDRVKGTNKILKLVPAQSYKWSVAAIIQEKIGVATKPWKFTVLGKALSSPTSRVVKKDKVIQLNFSHEKNSVHYSFKLFKNKKGILKRILDKQIYKKNTFKLNRKKFKKGEYKLEVSAKEKGYLDSYPAILEFYYDGYTIRYLGSDRQKARELRKWHLELTAGWGPGSPYSGTSGLFRSGSVIDITMPTIRLAASIGYQWNGEWGFHIANESYTSAKDSFFYRKIRLYYQSEPWRFGKFGISAGLGLFNLRSFVLIPDQIEDTRYEMPLRSTGFDWRLDLYYYTEGNWTYWVDFLFAISPELEDDYVYNLRNSEGNSINTVTFNAGYKFTEALDLVLSFSWHTQEFFFTNEVDTIDGVGAGSGQGTSDFRLDGGVGQVKFNFYY